MKHFLFSIVALSLCLVSCSHEEPAPKPDNQPKNPSTWSPIGKTYVCDRSDDNPEGYSYCLQLITFTDRQNGLYYWTISKDLSPMETFHFDYKIQYPNIILKFGSDESNLNFIDTLTLYWESLDQIYTLH